MTDRERKTKRSADEEADETVEAAPVRQDERDELLDDVDSLMDEIDDVLEENAEEFIKNYVQKGGE